MKINRLREKREKNLKKRGQIITINSRLFSKWGKIDGNKTIDLGKELINKHKPHMYT